MKVILVLVSSVDGKITRDRDALVTAWTSPEDQDYFKSLIDKNNLIIMGRHTYAAVQPAAQKGKLRIVYTHQPQQYALSHVSGQLEFTNESPAVLLERLNKTGYKRALLVGGSETASHFLQAGLVDEIWLTLEPVIFGKGMAMVKQIALDVLLTLKTVKRLNDNGTLLLKYAVK